MLKTKQIISMLEAHPEVQLINGYLEPEASFESIELAEEVLGTRLSPFLREFFREHNGMALEWIFKGRSDYSEEAFPREDQLHVLGELLFDDGQARDGQCIILPIEEIFVQDFEEEAGVMAYGGDEGWYEYLEEGPGDLSEAPIEFAGKTYASEGEFRTRLRYFDFFMNDISVALVLDHGNPDPPVIYESVRGGYLQLDKYIPLSVYLRAVLRDFGLRWWRYRYFDLPVGSLEVEHPELHLEGMLDLCRRQGR